MNKKNKTKYRKLISDKQKVYRILSRIYKELKNNKNVTLKRLRGCQGEYDFSDDKITIDFRKEVIPTLVHEFIHKFNPYKSESWVSSNERFIIRRMSPSQAKRLLVYLLSIT